MDFDIESIGRLLRGFEDGTWPATDFNHAAHLVVAACYILDGPALDRETPLDRLRARIPRYNVAQGGANTEDRGYHETLTCFWYHIVSGFVRRLAPGLGREEVVRRVVDEFSERRDLFREYYDFDVVMSREARSAWIPPACGIPDMPPLPPAPVRSTAPA